MKRIRNWTLVTYGARSVYHAVWLKRIGAVLVWFCLHPAMMTDQGLLAVCGSVRLGHLQSTPFCLNSELIERRPQNGEGNFGSCDSGLCSSAHFITREGHVYGVLVLLRASSSPIFSSCNLHNRPQETQPSPLSILLSAFPPRNAQIEPLSRLEGALLRVMSTDAYDLSRA